MFSNEEASLYLKKWIRMFNCRMGLKISFDKTILDHYLSCLFSFILWMSLDIQNPRK